MIERYFKSLVNRYTRGRLGKEAAQPLFEWLHLLGLNGMNYGTGWSIQGSGEVNALSYVRDILKNEKNPIVIFDVGANVGEYTKGLLDLFQDVRKEIHCFEPSVDTFRQLSNNISDKAVKFNQFGIGESDSTLKLYSDSSGSKLASVYKRKLEHFSIEMNRVEEIPVRSIDSYCIEYNIIHIHFLKLDIEGNELDALKGAKQMMDKGGIDFIQFEFGGGNIDSRTFFQDFYYLLSPRYDIFRILNDGIYPIKGYKETMEIFVTTNYLAKRKI